MPTHHNVGRPRSGAGQAPTQNNVGPAPVDNPTTASAYFQEIHRLRQQNQQSLQFIQQHQIQQQHQQLQFAAPRGVAYYAVPTSAVQHHAQMLVGSYVLQYPTAYATHATPQIIRRAELPTGTINLNNLSNVINPGSTASTPIYLDRDNDLAQTSQLLNVPKKEHLNTSGATAQMKSNDLAAKIQILSDMKSKHARNQGPGSSSPNRVRPAKVQRNLEPKPKKHTFTVPNDIAEIVSLASSLVAEEIRSCHYCYNGSKMSNSRSSSQSKAKMRAQSTSAAIEKFANDIVLQNILAAHAESLEVGKTSDPIDATHEAVDGESSSANHSHNSKERDHRIFIATLMSLREVIAMNAQEIFGFPVEEDEFAEGTAIKVQSLSTALVLNAISRLDDSDNLEITEKFLTAISQYDDGDEEFSSCLQRLDIRAIGVTPNGKPMKKHETLAYRVSYNTSRLEHPLIRKQAFSVETPPSNAAFVCVVEQIQQPKNTMEITPRGVNKIEVLERYRKKMKKFH